MRNNMHNRDFHILGCLALGAVVVACGGKSSDTGQGGLSFPTNSPAAGGSSANNPGLNSGGMWTEPVSTVQGPPAVDVLLMVDNSISMADKQQVLAASIPRLIDRLVQPNCVDTSGTVVGKSQLGVCAQGSTEFNPVNNLHIGVVTSSLGDHGGNSICAPGGLTSFTDSSGSPLALPDDVNDMAHLMGTLARGASALASDTRITQTAIANVDAAGFLAWSSASQAATSTDLNSAESVLRDMVAAAADRGCALESQLESWFRFLVDPVPPLMPITKDGAQLTHRLGSDDTLLMQRAAFLRPNSTLAIVMLTDENDCSLRDSDVGWVATDTKHSISTGSAACAINPNDKCCYSCTASAPTSGCSSGCPNGTAMAQDDSAYQANLRCWQQKRRFGYEFMYPVSRYVVGLTKRRLCPDQSFGDMDCDCTYANSIGSACSPGLRNLPNPLFGSVIGKDNAGNDVFPTTNVAPRADASWIFLAGIVGVPWQDIGTLDASGNLVYVPVTASEWTRPASTSGVPVTPAPRGIWTNIYGDDNVNIAPADPHMVESITPRPGLPSPESAPNADPINGHEWNTGYMDLEYACTFPLTTPRACACSSSDVNYAACKYLNPNDCCDLTFSVNARGDVGGGSFNKPLCNGNTQIAAKAYPGLREIAVLHDYALSPNAIGQNSVVASVCPSDLTSDPASPGYGYNPAIDALVARMKERL
jgi:hypothetical protein